VLLEVTVFTSYKKLNYNFHQSLLSILDANGKRIYLLLVSIALRSLSISAFGLNVFIPVENGPTFHASFVVNVSYLHASSALLQP